MREAWFALAAAASIRLWMEFRRSLRSAKKRKADKKYSRQETRVCLAATFRVGHPSSPLGKDRKPLLGSYESIVWFILVPNPPTARHLVQMLQAQQVALPHTKAPILIAGHCGGPECEFQIVQPPGAPAVFAKVGHHPKKRFSDKFLVCWALIAHRVIIGALQGIAIVRSYRLLWNGSTIIMAKPIAAIRASTTKL
jgi:hypothetical protein